MSTSENQQTPASIEPYCQRRQPRLALIFVCIFLPVIVWAIIHWYRNMDVRLGQAGVDALNGKATIYFQGDHYIGYDSMPLERPPGPIDDALVQGVAGRNNLTDADMVHLGKMPNLGILDLTATSITGKGLDHIRDATNLRVLWLPMSISDADLEPLSSLTHVADLKLSYSKVTDDGLKHLSGLTMLWQLQLSRTRVTDVGLKHLSNLQNLESLRLDETNITDVGLANLTGLTKLQDLLLTKTKITDAGLAYLAKIKNLRELLIDYTLVRGEGLIYLQSLTRLEDLRLGGTLIGDASLKYLGRISTLKNLDLSNTDVTDAGLGHLLTLSNLEFVSFDDTKVTKEGAEKLQKALPKCRIQYGELLGHRSKRP